MVTNNEKQKHESEMRKQRKTNRSKEFDFISLDEAEKVLETLKYEPNYLRTILSHGTIGTVKLKIDNVELKVMDRKEFCKWLENNQKVRLQNAFTGNKYNKWVKEKK